MAALVTGDKVIWLVIGGGPCGIASAGKLVDEGFSVVWVDDRQFQAGRMGEFYKNIPANTINGDLLKATRQCDSFKFEDSQDCRRRFNQKVMADLESDQCYDLKYFVDALNDATESLLKRVTSIVGKVERVEYDENNKLWKYTIGLPNKPAITGFVNAIINTCGSRPKPLPGFPLIEMYDIPKVSCVTSNMPICFYSLDRMVDPLECKNIVTNDKCPVHLQRWIIIGDSHSGILIVKNLIEAGIVDVVNIHKSPLRFLEITSTGKKKNLGIGLKGPVGDWARANIPHPYIQRVEYDCTKTWSDILATYTVDDDLQDITSSITTAEKQSNTGTMIRSHCVCAYGFERSNTFTIHAYGQSVTEDILDQYDRITGEITLPLSSSAAVPHHSGKDESCHRLILFGGGIAFPQDYIHEDGEREPWVGFRRSIEQTELMIHAFLTSSSLLHNVLLSG